MPKTPFHEALNRVLAEDPRYGREAYAFLHEALEVAQKRRRKSKAPASTHVSAAELLEGFRLHALGQFGPMVMTVLSHWGIGETGDVGRMVFNLINAGVFGRTDDDRLEDFENVFSFEEAFVEPFRPLESLGEVRPRRKSKLAGNAS